MIGLRSKLRIEDICAIAQNRCDLVLDATEEFRDAVSKNHRFFMQEVEKGRTIYGVTTGLGSSAKNRLSAEQAAMLQHNLMTYHGCGVGGYLPESICRATMVLRLNMLAQVRSGVSFDFIEHLYQLLQKGITALIPKRGSVGASGDLTPLSYIAAVMAGQRECYYQGKIMPSAEALRQAGIEPRKFSGRESLAIMNGTSVMTAISALCFERCERIGELTCQLTGMLVELMQARTSPFMELVHAHKPHPGQQKAAALILNFLRDADHRLFEGASSDKVYNHQQSIQDVYSIRCAPQVIGVLFDTLSWTRGLIETEANSANDNPLFIDSEELILNGGNFFGGHIAMAADALKIAVANTINLVDRQMALIMEPKVAAFLSENLAHPDAGPTHHGFKAMQITVSALSAETVKAALPMALYSRPTESSNQDVVSMGTSAALDLLHLLDSAEDVVSILAMAICQGFYVLNARGIDAELNKPAKQLLKGWQRVFAPLEADRAMDAEIGMMRQHLFAGESVYAG